MPNGTTLCLNQVMKVFEINIQTSKLCPMKNALSKIKFLNGDFFSFSLAINLLKSRLVRTSRVKSIVRLFIRKIFTRNTRLKLKRVLTDRSLNTLNAENVARLRRHFLCTIFYFSSLRDFQIA